MHSVQPLEILADELGATAGRIERELRLKDEARAAQFEARLAAIELVAFKAEEERQRIFGERLAQLKDGKDGRDGIDGKDADISHLEVRYNELEVTIWDHVKCAFHSVDQRVVERLAEVNDGKDGEPGKDADIAPLEARICDLVEQVTTSVSVAHEKIDAKLAEVKDGKDGEPGNDGEPGKNADITPLLEMFRQTEAEVVNRLSSLEEHLQQKIHDRLAEVRDGKDADIGPLTEEVRQAYESVQKDAEEKVGQLLSTVKNGKDGEPGKDADIAPLIAEIREQENGLSSRINSSLNSLTERVDRRLAEIKDGKPGRDGEDGEPGPPGKDGKLPIAREWTNRVHYAGDIVRHNGATYQTLVDTGHEPPHSDWGELASRGADGIGFILRGTYDVTAEYKQHDIVMLNRNSFAAKYDAPGECPGDGWQLFAPSGGRGKEGPPGGKGADAKSVSIANLEADADAMLLRITDSLGKTFTLDLEPIAERIIEAAR